MDPIVTCPYDVTHRIHKSVLPYHLVRCRKNHPLEKVQCPFDAFHVVDKEYLEHHMLNCASNGNIKKEQYNFEPPLQLGSVSLETVKNLSVPVMQDWKEENIKTYDPWENTENKSIIRCLIGLSKSQKKQFKLAERKRIYNLQTASIYAWNHKPCFKYKTSNKSINIAYIVQHLKRLSLDSIDALLQSIDINKLFISDINEQKTFMKRKCVSDVIEKVLVEQFKELVLHCLNTKAV